MRVLLDQNIRARLVAHLQALGHDAVRVGRQHPPGLPDTLVLALAQADGRILFTQDKDFVELVVRRRLPHAGVVLFQLGNADLPTWLARVDTLLRDHEDALTRRSFLFVSRDDVEVRPG